MEEVAATPSQENETLPNGIEIDQVYYVTWANGQAHPARIITYRRSRENKEEFEYYVHYLHHDRRLDEWVTINRIDYQTKVDHPRSSDNHDFIKNKKLKRKLDSESANSATTTSATGPSTITTTPTPTTSIIPTTTLREEKVAILTQLEREHEETTKIKNIQTIELGKYEINTWYFSAFPDEYCHLEKLYFCEYCLKYMKSETTLRSHRRKCLLTTPPGIQIYLENNLSMYEVDGKINSIYCQNLCLLSKLFLDHKTLYYDVESFLFYILCEIDQHGHHIVGYFSKEKHSQDNNNLACILTFPPYQRNGYGKFLISVSYELTKREETTGAPEKPLSDLGKISYRSYWAYIILQTLNKKKNLLEISLQDLIKETGIRYEDIVSTLHALNLIKYWKGQHVISISPQVITSHIQQTKQMKLCNPLCLTWIPSTRSAGTSTSNGSMGNGEKHMNSHDR